jgi:addiction module RelE/StbE family toxin
MPHEGAGRVQSMIWNVEDSALVKKVLTKAPPQIVRKYQSWLDMMRYHGPEEVARWRGFKDKKLKGTWSSYRSSRLNRQYRIIYRIDYESLTVFVEKVDTHTYR